jgi:hypothetical protein
MQKTFENTPMGAHDLKKEKA